MVFTEEVLGGGERENQALLTQFNVLLLLIQFIWQPSVTEVVDQDADMAQYDEWGRQPWLFVIRHDVSVTVVLPEFVRYGLHVKINMTVDSRGKQEGERSPYDTFSK